jgi:multicomponent Na+:H+ antiporter subunit F
MIALNIVASQILALLVLIAVSEARSVYLDVALVYDIFGFVGVLAITRYVETKEPL